MSEIFIEMTQITATKLTRNFYHFPPILSFIHSLSHFHCNCTHLFDPFAEQSELTLMTLECAPTIIHTCRGTCTHQDKKTSHALAHIKWWWHILSLCVPVYMWLWTRARVCNVWKCIGPKDAHNFAILNFDYYFNLWAKCTIEYVAQHC